MLPPIAIFVCFFCQLAALLKFLITWGSTETGIEWSIIFEQGHSSATRKLGLPPIFLISILLDETRDCTSISKTLFCVSEMHIYSDVTSSLRGNPRVAHGEDLMSSDYVIRLANDIIRVNRNPASWAKKCHPSMLTDAWCRTCLRLFVIWHVRSETAD